VSPDGKKLYVVSTKRDSVVVVSTADNKVRKEVKVPLGVPRRVAFTPDAKQLYVGSNKTPEIAIIDTTNDSVLKTFKVGNEARGGLAFTADGKTFFVGNVEDDTVSWVDTSTHQVIKTMGVPLSPQRIEISKDGKFAYVLTRMGGQEGGTDASSPVLFAMPILDKHDASRFVRVGRAPWGLAVSDDGGLIYVSSNADSTITVIDGKTLKVLATVPVNKDPQAVAFRP
jgi:YVTN family beta-propeller protein